MEPINNGRVFSQSMLASTSLYYYYCLFPQKSCYRYFQFKHNVYYFLEFPFCAFTQRYKCKFLINILCTILINKQKVKT